MDIKYDEITCEYCMARKTHTIDEQEFMYRIVYWHRDNVVPMLKHLHNLHNADKLVEKYEAHVSGWYDDDLKRFGEYVLSNILS